MKQLPQDISAEKWILSAMITSWDDKLLVSNIVTSINSWYFYDENNKMIYKALALLNSKSVTIDIITLKDQLEKFWVLETVWGIMWLTELASYEESSWHNYESYIKILKEKYYLRVLQSVSNSISDDIVRIKDPLEIIDWIQSQIVTLLWNVWSTWSMHISQVLQNRYEELSEMVENPELIKEKVIYTWYKGLDNMLWGLHRWNLCLIAARPAIWKSVTVLNIANNVIKDKKNVVLFSMEMSESELIDRMISLYSGINWFKLRTWKLSNEEMVTIQKAMDEMHKHNLIIDTTSMLTPNLLKSKLTKISATSKLDLVIVDYIGLMKEPSEKNKVNEIWEISRSLKLFAKEFNVPIIALSQLSRAVESRQDKRPVMSDLRDSWSLEQDADQIIFLYRDEVYDEFTEKKWIIELLIRKNRHWAIWKVDLNFDKSKQLITNIK